MLSGTENESLTVLEKPEYSYILSVLSLPVTELEPSQAPPNTYVPPEIEWLVERVEEKPEYLYALSACVPYT